MGHKMTVPEVVKMKERGEKIVSLTAYDYCFARILDDAGIDVLLVGDSLGAVVQGQDTTLPVTLEDILYHTKAVIRARRRALVVSDMPFLTFQVGIEDAKRNAGRLLQEGGAEAVKLEGGVSQATTIEAVVRMGIPVMGHIGLTPQSVHQFGGYQPRGATADEARSLLKDAAVLEQAGAFAIVLEKVPASLAKRVTKSVNIPTIGIGAGVHCDGQILVTPDMLGLYEDFQPRFVRLYSRMADETRAAVGKYVGDVKRREFPGPKESY